MMVWDAQWRGKNIYMEEKKTQKDQLQLTHEASRAGTDGGLKTRLRGCESPRLLPLSPTWFIVDRSGCFT